MNEERTRCRWATGTLLVEYHDNEWGVAVHDDAVHFEYLTLEAAQAGLSWLTILARRDGYRTAFAGFNPSEVARFDPDRVAVLMEDTSIIRNRRKIEATVTNAAAFCAIQQRHGTFDEYLWDFVDGAPIINHWTGDGDIPAHTDLSAKISGDLKAQGFRFLGPTVCYSHLQAAGLVIDHTTTCFRHPHAQA